MATHNTAITPDVVIIEGLNVLQSNRVEVGKGLFVSDFFDFSIYVDADDADIEQWYTRFPRLRERRAQRAGSLSGGEQQMLAIARALMSRPRLLLCDEPSLGLAPLITQELFDVLVTLNREEGLSVLLVEQNANLAMKVATRVYLLETGRIVASGTAAELSADDSVRKAYLGI